MIVPLFSLLRMVGRFHYVITREFDLVIVLFVVLEGRVSGDDAAVHSEAVFFEGAEAVLVPPEPAGQFGQDFEELGC